MSVGKTKVETLGGGKMARASRSRTNEGPTFRAIGCRAVLVGLLVVVAVLPYRLAAETNMPSDPLEPQEAGSALDSMGDGPMFRLFKDVIAP